MSRPRGIVPTYVTEREVVLCKSGLQVRDTYEVRLCLFLAVKQGLQFVLSVRPDAEVDPAVEASIAEHGGRLAREAQESFSVSVGVSDPGGDSWVLGDDQALRELHRLVPSAWFGATFVPGAVFEGDGLIQLGQAVSEAEFTMTNVDGEDVRLAILDLAQSARRSGSSVYVQ